MTARVPRALPVLGAGRHRSPRHGVCLMEFTSILAGTRFSDRPPCTDPVLAALARAVNDYSSDASRQRLAVLAADLSVAGPAADAVRFGVARRALLTALPHASGGRRQMIVTALLGVDRAASGAPRGWHPSMLDPDTELALLDDRALVAAAAATLRDLPVSVREYTRRALPYAVELAVATIGGAAAAEPARLSRPCADRALRELLVSCLAEIRTAPVRSHVAPVAATGR